MTIHSCGSLCEPTSVTRTPSVVHRDGTQSYTSDITTYTHVTYIDKVDMFGYFNIHLDLPSLNTRSFMDVLQTYALH